MTTSIRALHVVADEAEKTFIKLGLVRNHQDEELRAAAMACYKADQALRIALEDINEALIARNEEQTVETYDRLIAAALAAHETDTTANATNADGR